MRKRLKLKKRSCAMCKPHKMGCEGRWKPKEKAQLEAFERTMNKHMGALQELAKY
jgi:hypothetical protein